MKGSFVQVGRSGGWGLGAGGLPGSEGSSKPSWICGPAEETAFKALPRQGLSKAGACPKKTQAKEVSDTVLKHSLLTAFVKPKG
jgi:hypothetical protein